MVRDKSKAKHAPEISTSKASFPVASRSARGPPTHSKACFPVASRRPGSVDYKTCGVFPKVGGCTLSSQKQCRLSSFWGFSLRPVGTLASILPGLGGLEKQAPTTIAPTEAGEILPRKHPRQARCRIVPIMSALRSAGSRRW